MATIDINSHRFNDVTIDRLDSFNFKPAKKKIIKNIFT